MEVGNERDDDGGTKGVVYSTSSTIVRIAGKPTKIRKARYLFKKNESVRFTLL